MDLFSSNSSDMLSALKKKKKKTWSYTFQGNTFLDLVTHIGRGPAAPENIGNSQFCTSVPER